MKSLDQVRSEFDRIAELSSRLPDVVGPHEAALIEQLPRGMSIALDVGCGTGAVARRLAERCDRVVGIDLSPQMIREAENRSAAFPTVEYHVAAAEEWLTYLTVAEAREVYSRLLPGSLVSDHLIWRYSVLWRKPRGA